ncbi:hypothetical protein [Nocardia sp. CA-119907]|uniref:hypothetical protein n=1 Tax=Nocardia sp. CA-119907 TaxID=3239973 RepID=UPI003D983B74
MISPTPPSAEHGRAATALLFDFGGVLTSSMFGASLGCDPGLPLRLISKDPTARALLVEHQEGRSAPQTTVMVDNPRQHIDAAERVGRTGVPHREPSATAALCGAPTNERAMP